MSAPAGDYIFFLRVEIPDHSAVAVKCERNAGISTNSELLMKGAEIYTTLYFHRASLIPSS
jgi:hypothetical protein